MRPLAVLAILAIAGPMACMPFADIGLAEPPAPLPDLSVSPEDIEFTFYGDPLEQGISGLPIDIGITVRNAGQANSSSANVTIFIDDVYAATIHVMKNLTVEYPDNASTVHFTWDTTGAEPGNHTIRAVANDSAGDALAADNVAEKIIRIVSEYPVFSIALTPTVSEVTVTSVDSGTARFNGTVNTDLGDWTEAMVFLNPSVDIGWPASLTPNTFSFTGSDSRHFNVSVRVPPDALTSNHATLKVDGWIVAGGYNGRATSQAIITVRPFYRVRVESEAPKKDLAIGGEAVLDVRVWNLGNAVDSFDLAVENLGELRSAGWGISLNKDMLAKVNPQEYRIMNIRIRAPQDWSIYEDRSVVIRLKVSSLNDAADGGNVSHVYSLTVRERGFNIPCTIASLGVTAVLVVFVAAVLFKKRGKTKVKTLKDYLKELNIEEGD